MTDQLDGAGRPLGVPPLADAIAQRAALDKMLLAAAAAPLAAVAARIEAAGLAAIVADIQAILPLLPAGPQQYALAASADIIARTPGMIAEVRQLAQAASA